MTTMHLNLKIIKLFFTSQIFTVSEVSLHSFFFFFIATNPTNQPTKKHTNTHRISAEYFGCGLFKFVCDSSAVVLLRRFFLPLVKFSLNYIPYDLWQVTVLIIRLSSSV